MGKKTFMKKLPLLSSICWREIFFHLVHLAHTAFSFINYFIDFITCEIDLRKIAQGSKFEKSGHLQNFKITFIESVLLYRQYVFQNEELMSNTYRTKKTLGDRAFENAAPKVWNRLPLEIRQCQSLNIFKVLLKTHLFKLAFYQFFY